MGHPYLPPLPILRPVLPEPLVHPPPTTARGGLSAARPRSDGMVERMPCDQMLRWTHSASKSASASSVPIRARPTAWLSAARTDENVCAAIISARTADFLRSSPPAARGTARGLTRIPEDLQNHFFMWAVCRNRLSCPAPPGPPRVHDCTQSPLPAAHPRPRGLTPSCHITLAPKKLILTRRASEGSASEPSLARRASMCKDAKLSCRGNNHPSPPGDRATLSELAAPGPLLGREQARNRPSIGVLPWHRRSSY